MQQATETTQPTRLLTPDERNDLRKRVLAGIQLTVEEARSVIASIRQGQGVAALAGEAKSARGSKRSKREAMSDEALDASLKGLGID